MLSALFSVSSGLTLSQAVLLMFCAAGCGLLIALTAQLSGTCSRSFMVSLIALPVVVQVVILMVNGNVGTGVAVLGAFSLIRFRSVPGSSRDITLIFLAMAAGLATGMAYAGYALLATVVVCGLLLLFTHLPLGERFAPLYLRITIPEDLDYLHAFDDLFETYTRHHHLESVKTTGMGSLFELHYTITLKDPAQEKDFIDALRCRNGNLTLSLSRSIPAHEAL